MFTVDVKRQYNKYNIPCGSSATEILYLLDVYSPNLLVYIYIYITPNIYLVSLVFSESGGLSFANGKDATHKEELNIRRVLH